MKQYEIWWAQMPLPVGRRPVLLLSRTPAYEYLSRIIIVEITTTIRSIPQEVRLTSREGLSHECAANFDNLHAIPKTSLTERIGAISIAREREIKRALGSALGWAELKQL